MNAIRIAPPVLVLRAVSVLLALVLLQALLAPASHAFKIEKRSGSTLDGKVVMSPATERIETVTPDGGELVGPGMTVRRPVIIHNRSEREIEFDLTVSQVVGSNAELIVEVRHGVREGAAAWVELERTNLTLKPGEQGTVLATIRIPKSIKPGSKPFAVTATQRSYAAPTGGAGIAPTFAQTAIFVVELPGDAPIKGGLTNATLTSTQKSAAAGRSGEPAPRNPRLYVGPGWTDAHDLRLTAVYENDGERLLSPTGRVIVKDVFGRTAATYQVPRFSVYPGGEAGTMVQMKGLPSLGLFTATVELESVAAGTQTTTLPRFVLVPRWLVVVLGALVLYGAAKLLRWWLRRRREWKAFLADEEAGGSGTGEVDPLAWDQASDEPDDDLDEEWVDEPERTV